MILLGIVWLHFNYRCNIRVTKKQFIFLNILNYNDILVKRKPMASGEYLVFARYLRILSRLTWNFVSRY